MKNSPLYTWQEFCDVVCFAMNNNPTRLAGIVFRNLFSGDVAHLWLLTIVAIHRGELVGSSVEGKLCRALNVFVLVLDISVTLPIVGTIAVEGNDEGENTEKGKEQQETFFYSIDKLRNQDPHHQIIILRSPI